jgi:hypothetical protein
MRAIAGDDLNSVLATLKAFSLLVLLVMITADWLKMAVWAYFCPSVW